MKIKTIKKVLTKKLSEWLLTIDDEKLRKDVRENLLVSGGSIASMFLREDINDFDVYIKDMDVLIRLAEHYCPGKVLDGRKRDEYVEERGGESYENSGIENLGIEMVRRKNLWPDQVKLDIDSVGVLIPLAETENAEEEKKYAPIFLSQNAISLTDDIQIVLRFNGDAEKIHSTFDFVHATNYFTFEDGLVTNVEALQCLLTKELRYQGSLYPLTSIIRMKKFTLRGWSINAGEILKIMFQISELDLKDPLVLEEQLIGVDIAYFAKLIEILRDVKREKLTSSYINTVIDRVFNEYEEEI